MRTCPQCRAQYDDFMSFCTEDGTLLVTESDDVPNIEADTKTPITSGRSAAGISDAVTEVMHGHTVDEGLAGAPGSVETRVAQVGTRPRSTGFAFLLGALLVITLLILGSAIGGGLWYLRGGKPVDVATTNSNQSVNTVVNAPATPVFGSAGANLPDENKPLENSTLSSNAAPTPKPVQTEKPKPDDTSTPEEVIASTPVPPTKPGPVRPISGGVLNGRATSLPKAPYPPAARAVGASGPVNVQVLVDETGRVVKANAISGHPLLRNSAERAARNAKFPPPARNGQPVTISGIIVYIFRKE